MRQTKSKIDRASIAHANGRAKQHAESILKKAESLKNDSNQKERVKECKCKTCFYLLNERIGGAAMTNRECGICEKDMLFSSTSTEPICIECAKKNGLCKQCGGDIETKERRKPYPFMEKNNEI